MTKPCFRVDQVGNPLLKPASFELDGGKTLVISGESGSGKTVLLRSLADLDEHQGEMFVRQQAASSMRGYEWRRSVALLPADSSWWHTRVADHFTEVDAEALCALGLRDNIMQSRIDRISSGEKQRLALLRLLQNKPIVLLLDEPTANLDPASENKVEACIKQYQLQHSAAVIWISHDPEQAARVGDYHATMREGQLSPFAEAVVGGGESIPNE